MCEPSPNEKLAPTVLVLSSTPLNREQEIERRFIPLFYSCNRAATSGWGIEATPDLLTLNRIIAISTLTMGVIVFRIPAWVGNNLREPALIGGAINTAWVINVGYNINVGATSGASVTINLVLVIIFAILFFVMGARHKNS